MPDTRRNTETTGSPYDDVCRTLIVDCPKLVIPVVNEIFQKEYDAHTKVISLENELYVNQQDSQLINNTFTVNFPNTAIMYLRHNQNTPDSMTVVIKVPGDECNYKIPIMKISTYNIEEIFEKKLYFLIPFHIFVYEKNFKEYDSNEQKLALKKV